MLINNFYNSNYNNKNSFCGFVLKPIEKEKLGLILTNYALVKHPNLRINYKNELFEILKPYLEVEAKMGEKLAGGYEKALKILHNNISRFLKNVKPGKDNVTKLVNNVNKTKFNPAVTRSQKDFNKNYEIIKWALKNNIIKEKNLPIVNDRLNGSTYPELAKKYNLTVNQIRHICLVHPEHHMNKNKNKNMIEQIKNYLDKNMFPADIVMIIKDWLNGARLCELERKYNKTHGQIYNICYKMPKSIEIQQKKLDLYKDIIKLRLLGIKIRDIAAKYGMSPRQVCVICRKADKNTIKQVKLEQMIREKNLDVILAKASLTNREREIVELKMQGLSTTQIAEKIGINRGSVASRFSEILQKYKDIKE